MRVLFDTKTIQANLQNRGGKRLLDFFQIVAEISNEPCLGTLSQTIDAGCLAVCDILVVPTRREPYEDCEVAAIQKFVEDGGGLLLMSNHGDIPENHNNWTRYDFKLAQAFNVNLQRAWFEDKNKNPALLSDGDLNFDHPIMSGVDQIAFNNCCGVSGAGTWLARLNSSVYDRVASIEPTNFLFGVALDYGKGRVVVTADSGFVGNSETTAGLIDMRSNKCFLKNILLWLDHQEIVELVEVRE